MSKPLTNTFGWSVTRDQVFLECARQYWYRYYGSWGGWERDADPLIREIYVLKQLKTRPLWIGQVVHECVQRSLSNVARGIPVLDTDEILEITRNTMRTDFRDSRARRYREEPRRACGLFEHEYERNVPDEKWREAAEQVDTCLRNFYESDTWAMLRRLPPDDFLEIEHLSKIEYEDDEIMIKLDLAIREADRIVIYDWKTGRQESAHSNLQLACYAYYASSRYNVPIHAVLMRRVELFRDVVREDKLGSHALAELLEYIRGSIKDMKALLDDPERNLSSEAAFARTRQLDRCTRCNFLKVCRPEGIPGTM